MYDSPQFTGGGILSQQSLVQDSASSVITTRVPERARLPLYFLPSQDRTAEAVMLLVEAWPGERCVELPKPPLGLGWQIGHARAGCCLAEECYLRWSGLSKLVQPRPRPACIRSYHKGRNLALGGW